MKRLKQISIKKYVVSSEILQWLEMTELKSMGLLKNEMEKCVGNSKFL